MKIATADCWSTTPLAERRQALDVARSFSPEEFVLLQRGLIPHSMDDKWFIYYLDNVLHLHRGWTGHEIYQLGLDSSDPATIKITYCWVTRDPKHYQGTDDAEDAALVSYLIDLFLLNRQAAFPAPADLPPQQVAALRHNIVGSGRPSIS